MQVTETTNS